MERLHALGLMDELIRAVTHSDEPEDDLIVYEAQIEISRQQYDRAREILAQLTNISLRMAYQLQVILALHHDHRTYEAETILDDLITELGSGDDKYKLNHSHMLLPLYAQISPDDLGLLRQLGDSRSYDENIEVIGVLVARHGFYQHAERVAYIIREPDARARALREIAIVMGRDTQLKSALAMLGGRDLDEFIDTVLCWCPDLRQAAPDLPEQVLGHLTRIVGWLRSDWGRVYAELAKA
jgi:hypothetical protein